MLGVEVRAQALTSRGLARMRFRQAEGQRPEMRRSGARSFAQAVVQTIVKATIGGALERRGLAALVLVILEAAALGSVVSEFAEPVPVKLAPEQIALLSLELPALPDCPIGVRLRHWSPVPQPAHWPALRNLSPAGQARWVVRCSIFSL
ncbi:hypothetical protein [Nisaea sp.]|uniref:hypothetical protein n=1 Tax=Nisaea sp. TaxID=2024842 RepID=UPI0032971B0C